MVPLGPRPGPYLDHILHHVHVLQRPPIIGLGDVGILGTFRMFNPSIDRVMNINLVVVNGNITSSTKVSSVIGTGQ